MTTSIAVFTSDLRLRDNPVLHAALRAADQVVPLFVADHGLARTGFAVPNRVAFLADALADLDAGLRERGGALVLRKGDPVAEIRRVADRIDATEVHIAGGVSGYAGRREARLRAALAADGRTLRVHGAVVTAVEPGEVVPAGKDHFAVFTPYFRAWQRIGQRRVLAAPRAVPLPELSGLRSEPLSAVTSLAPGTPSPGLPEGGETAGRRRFHTWRRSGLDGYADDHDDLAGDATSRLSPYLHFGCLSPVELVCRARESGGAGAEAFVRQLAWRDFHHQVLAARPDAAHTDYRARHDRWRADDAEIAAWKAGRTGYPLVDAGMRQLGHEGWMHNRARLLVASFLTKTLYTDWRIGAQHFLDLLVDGDMANNQLNWQWVAGTGTDTRPNRVLNPLAQARRFDPDGAYVRRWVPELAGVRGPRVHTPWRLPEDERSRLDYPDPIVDLEAGLARFRRARRRD
ncbi:cryptochrome/photolyase family protein [Streptomyces coffeae]|uniref:Deoxyribodipyrimidine photo-lyase n=1 Tax=Streptomyces coffeae TaxID=621382 RepID=A0ABS1NM24_9ACTN|nr:deoxyribodipyrimidine photo-lyase [Streptomyces coffeae]MBL1100900.1 deoxyribodipyrimidine photo-lyase [Streptomyces coffeae]